MSTKTAPTAHGEVEYETVECASCETEVAKENAFRYVMIDPDEIRRERSRMDYYRWEVNRGGYAEGWACPMCYDEPISYPGASLNTEDKFFFGLLAVAIALPTILGLIEVIL